MSGPREATDVFVREVTSHLLSPIRRLASDALRSLPSVGGTLILDGVEALDRQQQEMFLRWLVEGSHTKTQVISLTPTRLYSQVQTGEFLPALYYRLNVIYVEVSLVDAER